MKQLLLLSCLALLAPGLPAQKAPGETPPAAVPARDLRPSDLSRLKWRSIGPANMGGRVTDLAVDPDRPSTFFVATASGGVWRTRNGGTTFEAVFDDHGSASIGAIAMAPGDSKVIWVGTGEANIRNSVSWGNGVYRSEDGGESWTHMGLRDTRHIGAIAIHPDDAQVVYVAAVGNAWSPGPERGIFRSLDGGRTWNRVLALDDVTGAIDVLIDPETPSRVFAAAYRVSREPFDTNDPQVKYGEKAGIYRSEDGGDTWTRLEKGLPTGKIGRIGLDLARSEPGHLFAVVESEWTGRTPPRSDDDDTPAERGPAYLGVRGESLEGKAVVTQVVDGTAAKRAGLKNGDVIIAIDDVKISSWNDLGSTIRDRKEGDEAVIRVKREEDEKLLEVTFGGRPGRGVRGPLGGQIANAQGRQGKRGFETGGVFRSRDHGETWKRVNSLTPRPFYFSQIRVDPTDASRVWVMGIQLHVSTNGGARFRANGALRVHPDHHALWINPNDPRHLILGNDGGVSASFDRGRSWDFLGTMPLGQYYAVAMDDRRPYRVFGGLQDNGTWVIPSRSRHPSGIPSAQAVTINGGDGFVCAVDPTDSDVVYCESQNGGMARVNLRTGRRRTIARPERPKDGSEPRPRWNWRTPFLLSPHNPRTFYFGANRVGRSRDRGASSRWISDDLCASDRGSLTALTESPEEEGRLWAGSDDGALSVTRDGGRTWERIEKNLPDLPGPRWVSCIEPSRADADRVYVALDGHRNDDQVPHVYRSDDGGKTFERKVTGLPDSPVRVIREDPADPSILYVGNEIGVWVSLNGGDRWMPLRSGLPTVPVHDLQIHARDRELVAATHGRSIWILDVAPLPRMAGEGPEPIALLKPRPSILWSRAWTSGAYGKRRFFGDSGPRGPVLHYWLDEEAAKKPELTIATAEGKEILKLSGGKSPGLHAVTWRAPRGRRGRGKGPRVGEFIVTLKVGDVEQRHLLTVLPDPEDRSGIAAGVEVKP